MALSSSAQRSALAGAGATSRRLSGMAPMRAPTSAAAINRVADWAPSCPLTLPRGRRVVARAGDTATPVVKIDNMNDAFATIVKVDIGGAAELLDTVSALRSLGLNIRKAKVAGDMNEFYITESVTSEKVIKSARLEEIRVTVMQSLKETFPDSGASFNIGARMDSTSDDNGPTPVKRLIKTTIDVREADNGSCSILTINTIDRPGLLVDIVKVLKDVNLNVVSAEVDTIGSQAHDEFFVTYKGEPLATPMQTLVINSLNYYLSLNEVATVESY
uniref:ACT domain-containing protein n=1 Tax=Chlamydomonas euryale TaxID=1486919 RepID=A0A7R9VQQ1_9CHLO|mmetsp:Transcript_41626/g.124444  ORF Transcript_41626/g.124444 Transcript_41626/m.124444 type:complete len:274 (+) Transcript_41626:81-902(+)